MGERRLLALCDFRASGCAQCLVGLCNAPRDAGVTEKRPLLSMEREPPYLARHSPMELGLISEAHPRVPVEHVGGTVISQRDMERWLNPWPIAFRERKAQWELVVLPWTRAGALTCLWRHGRTRRRISWWAREAARGTAPQEQHYLHSLARHAIPTMTSLTVVAVHRDGKHVVVDGNHRLISLLMVKRYAFMDVSCSLTHVGVVVRR